MERQILNDLEVSVPKPVSIISREDELDKIVKQVEEEARLTALKLPARRHFNQPNLLSVSSLNATGDPADASPYSQTGYYKFNVNLPLPILDVESLQLLNANIPQASQNISDTACVFWYYRMSAYSGVIPNPNNLFMVRLLPSYYKQEFISSASTYGFNRTFKKYSDLATELAKSCANDLAWNNQLFAFALDSEPTNQPSLENIPFRPNDISLTYNSGINKFQMTGNPTNPVSVHWDSGTTYALDDIVAYAPDSGLSVPFPIVAYQSLVSENTSNIPPDSVTFWKPLYSTECVAKWDSTTVYPAGRYVSYNNELYTSLSTNIYAIPNGTFPNWVSGNTYYFGELVVYSGTVYTATATSSGTTPPSSGPFYPTIYQLYTPYVTGFVCDYEGAYYVALQNSTGRIPSTNPTYWRIAGPNGWFWGIALFPNNDTNAPVYNYLSTGYDDPNVAVAQGTGRQVWNPYNLYETSQIVSYNGVSYTNDYQSQNEVPFNVGGATITSGVMTGTTCVFEAANNFSVGQLVNVQTNRPIVNGTFRIIACNSGSFTVANSLRPSTLSITGTAAYPTFQIVGAWSNSTSYTQFNIVSYAGQYYSAKNPNTGVAPDDSTELSPGVTQGQIYWNALGTILYQTNDVVFYANQYYRAFQSVTDLNQYPAPANSSWNRQTWLSSGPSPPVCNLSEISQTWDMLTLSPLFANELIYQFPYGVPPQPFVVSPKRLLNTVLGFTWNGQFLPTTFQLINQFTTNIPRITTENAQLFNRVRPVPVYLVGDPVFELMLGTIPNTTTTYTADGYCNLVFSSVIYIYSTIVLASSVDTQRTSNLLAVMPFNCGNLGVSFGANFIENPLTKVHGDLYTVGIELYNEYAEPYYLTNNAVASFIFKMSYKSAEKSVQNIL